MKNKSLELLQERIGYRFVDPGLLQHAMIHSSYTNESRAGLRYEDCNERLEFLGDAVLELMSSAFLFREYPHKTEGELTKLRASIVCEPTLAACAREIELGSFLIMGHGEDMTGGRNRDSIISDALEALIGAIYLDGGLEQAKKFVETFVLNDIEQKHLFYDSKTILQERVQQISEEPVVYEIIREEGPEHDKFFWAQVSLHNQILGTGKGHTKKSAQQMAAYQALLSLSKEKEQ